MRKKARWRLTYGLGLLLKCAELVLAQCNDGQPQQINTAEPSQGYITSPNFPQPYRPGLRCVWKLNASVSSGLVVQLNMVELDILGPFSGSSQCIRDYILLIIVDRTGKEHVSQRYCGHPDNKDLPVLNTLQPMAEIVFVSSDATTGRNRGFRLHYSFVREIDIPAPLSLYRDPNERYRRECGGSTRPTEISGEIKSPGFPFTYPANVTCNWLIRVPEGKRIYLRLIHLQLSTTFAECARACLYIIDGFKHELPSEQQSGTMPGEVRFCGSHMYYNEEGMKSYLSNANRVVIRFVTTSHPSSDQMTARHTDGIAIGFKVLWTEVNSLVAADETMDVDCSVGFTCKGGEFCIDNGHNVCAERMRLCINETLKCNGVSNCAENDHSDEDFCYQGDVISYVIVFTVAAFILCIISCFFRRLLKICFPARRGTSEVVKHRSTAAHRRRPANSSKQESTTFEVHGNSIPKQSISIVNSTNHRIGNKHSQASSCDLLSLNPIGNDLNPVWQLDSKFNKR